MQLVVIAHNIRSTHNVGSILRTADGFGVSKVILSGYSPYPSQPGDVRLPHLRNKITEQIHKTALGAETTVANEYIEDVNEVITGLKHDGFTIVGLEQNPRSVTLHDFKPKNDKLALLLGEEVNGIEPHLINLCDQLIEIPMRGKKESFNVSVAAGISIYELSKSQV